ncbi:MAG TPA: SDR family oxidoreductase [Gaiella sp.]|nr:SDR family oxidoreductase [Gaiella sp.]
MTPGRHGPWPILAGRSAVVTGGANGIGAAVVRELAAAGTSPGVVLDLEPSLGRRTAPDGWREVAVDLRDDDSIRSAFAEARDVVGGTIDVLVAVAGIVPAWTGIADLDPDVWDDVFRVNARGVMRTVQEAEPALSDGGAIVVIASQNAWRGNENLASYVASKHAALGLVRSLALELGVRGIRVNAIGPGSIATEAYRARLKAREDAGGRTVEEALTAEGLTTPLQRLATAEEVARVVLFLASDLASGVSGHIVPVGSPFV